MDADDGLRASDRTRLVGLDGSPDAALITKERLDHLQGAFDELSDVHTRVLVMRELEGMSYREIGQKLDLTRPAVESALFRARRRLESEYASSPRAAAARRWRARSRASRRACSAARRSTGSRATRAAATAAAAAPASLGSSRCRRWARCARRPPRCCRCPGCCAARAEMAVGSLDSSERARTQPRWRSVLRHLWPWRRWPARGARRLVPERYRGTARLPGTAAWRQSAPRSTPRNCSAAPPELLPRTESVGGCAGRPGREIPVRRGAAPAVRRAPRPLPRAHRMACPATGPRGPALGGSAPSLDGSAPDLPAVPGTGDGSQPPAIPLETLDAGASAGRGPGARRSSLPQVEVPATPLPSVDDVTDALPKLP